MTVTGRDLRLALETVRAINQADDEQFVRTTLRAAGALVRCDTVSYNEQNLLTGERRACSVEPSYVERNLTDPGYRENVGQHPVFAVYRSGRLRPGGGLVVSDVLSARAFHRLPLYAEHYRHREVEDQLVALLTDGVGYATMLVFSRGRRGFSARDRALVDLLVPHLQQAVARHERLVRLGATMSLRSRRDIDPAAWQTLTERESQIVRCLGGGATDRQIGRALELSPRTVGKHLESVYRKLGLPGRTALVGALEPQPADR